MNILLELIFIFWFFGPAGVANMAAFFSSRLPYIGKFSYPVDAYLMFRGKRILGSHKTVRGFVVGILAAIAIVYLQVFLYQSFWFVRAIVPLDYTTINPILFGFLAGFGALLGDSVKSFFKRQRGINPGRSWFPFDQIDYILGGMVFTWFYIPLTIWEYLLLFVLWFLIHPFTTVIGYLLKLKKDPL